MSDRFHDEDTSRFLKSLGFPAITVHHAVNHFDFRREARRILVIGPMGSGKTEYSSRVWRDAQVTLKKSDRITPETSREGADRRNVFFIRSQLDGNRFREYPKDALAYRGGYIRCGENIAKIRNSFELESVIADHPEVGTWIIDEASFYDERLVYVVRHESISRGLIFIFPTLVLNFRKEIFNSTARLLLEASTDVFPLTAYCEHDECIEDSFYTYRYYLVDRKECPALYFDPLIVIGGDTEQHDPGRPNYCTRCDDHHFLPGKEYTFFHLKPLGEIASRGEIDPLRSELAGIVEKSDKTALYRAFKQRFVEETDDPVSFNALRVPYIAEKALVYLYTEANLLTVEQLRLLTEDLHLDREYLVKTLADNHRPVALD